jgi:hypothetical protein
MQNCCSHGPQPRVVARGRGSRPVAAPIPFPRRLFKSGFEWQIELEDRSVHEILFITRRIAPDRFALCGKRTEEQCQQRS